MKKLWKRALALLFILSLLLTLTLPAMAEEPVDTGEPSPTEGGDPAPGEEGGDPAPGEEGEPDPEDPDPDPAPEDGGEEPEPQEPAEELPAQNQEIFVSQNGSDETGDGSETAPFRTLARAAKMANALPELPAVIYLMTDLEMKESARFTARNVTILAADKPVTITRAEGMKTVKDEAGKVYNPAMIELRALEGAANEGTGKTAGSLLLINVILDDAGRREGSLFEIPSQPETPEEDGENEEPAEEEPADQAPSDDPKTTDGNKTNDGPALVQDAIVSVGDGGSLTLGTGAELRNFGGLSAVHLGEKSKLTMQAGSAILDTKEADNQRDALLKAGSAKVELLEGAKLLQRSAPAGDSPSALGDLIPGVGELSFSSLDFSAPETLAQDETVLSRYEIPYLLSFTVSDTVRDLIESQKDNLKEAAGVITVTLDSRMEGDESLLQTESKLESGVFELDGDVSYSGETRVITARFKLKEDWKDHLDTLSEPMTFSCKGYLPVEKFEPSTESEDKVLTSSGKVSITLEYTLGTEDKTSTIDSTEKTAETKMVGLPLSTIVYDVNGGDEDSGPQSEKVAAQKSYTLKNEPAPTHAPEGGDDVIFLGWSAEPDKTIYERVTKDSQQGTPALITTVNVPAESTVTVYAVYSRDINSDGIPDYRQKIAILSFDGNAQDAENVPDPIIHVVGSTEGGELGVNIPRQEPQLIYYTFLGWGETPDATDDGKLYKFDAERESRRDIAVTEDMTLYAVWKENYKINYDANGGQDAPAPTVLPYMTKVTGEDGKSYYTGRARITTGVPTRAGYEFKGWSPSRRGTAAYFAGDEVQISKGDVTLYAVWVRTGGGGGTAAPKTGDSNMGIYAAILGLSVLGLAGTGLVLWRKRRSE